MENDKDMMLEEYMVVETLVKDNPCGMPTSVISSLRNVLNDFIGQHCIERADRNQVAKYFGIDVRTLTRWRTEFPDFPEGKVQGKRDTSFNWVDIIRWKLKHKELFAD